MKAPKFTEFIQIPAVGEFAAYIVDPLNRAHVASLIRRADAYFKQSAQDWEDGNNSGDSEFLDKMEARAQQMANNGAALLTPLGIKCKWPGLYPSFEVHGFTEHATQTAVLAAIGHPRNWLI